jgi:hypothetical protein
MNFDQIPPGLRNDAAESPPPRYIVQHTEFGEAVLFDTELDESVRTESGQVYEAPLANALWAAERMNRPQPTERFHSVDGEPEIMPEPEPEPEPEPMPEPQAIFWAAYDRRTAGSVEPMPTERDLMEKRADEAHARTLKYATRTGMLEGHLSGIRAELVGLRSYLETYPEGLPMQYATDYLTEQFEAMISRINQKLGN